MTKTLLTEFVAFSDHHAHNFPYKETRKTHPELPGLYNSRLLASASVLREIREYCEEHGLPAVFGGDLFHLRSVIHTDVWNVTQNELLDWQRLYMIPGNHDYADRAGNITSLDALGGHAEVLRTVTEQGIDDVTSLFTVPYTDKLDVAKERLFKAAQLAKSSDAKVKILLAHLGMQGAKVGSDYVLVKDSDIEVDDVEYEAFDLCLFGHFHQHQKLFANGFFIGATHQHVWSDANTQRGFLHVKIYEDSFDLKFIETETAPRFWSLDAESEQVGIRPQDFVKYRLSKGEDEEAVCLPYDNVQFVDPPTNDGHIVLTDEDLSMTNIIESWVTAQEDIEDKDQLIVLGKELLAEAERNLL